MTWCLSHVTTLTFTEVIRAYFSRYLISGEMPGTDRPNVTVVCPVFNTTYNCTLYVSFEVNNYRPILLVYSIFLVIES